MLWEVFFFPFFYIFVVGIKEYLKKKKKKKKEKIYNFLKIIVKKLLPDRIGVILGKFLRILRENL